MSNVLTTLILFGPMIVVLWLANLADRRRITGQEPSPPAVLAYTLLLLPYLALIALGLVLYAVGLSTTPLPAEVLKELEAVGIDAAHASAIFRALGLAFWLPSVGGIILLLPPVRRLLALAMPIDAGRTVHAIALSYSMLILVQLSTTLAMGLRVMAMAVAEGAPLSPGTVMLSTWIQEIAMALMALIGVGWLSRRGLQQTLGRLGLVRPTLRQAAVGIGAGLLLVPLVLAMDALARAFGLAEDASVARLTEALIGPLFHSLPGVLTLGLAAALGEEAIFRGALQPRFGLLPTAALFALVHAYNGLTLSTAVVVVLALALGIVRERTNTTASMIAHASYNIALGLLAFLGS